MARQGTNMQFYITQEICQTIGELTPIKHFDEDCEKRPESGQHAEPKEVTDFLHGSSASCHKMFWFTT